MRVRRLCAVVGAVTALTCLAAPAPVSASPLSKVCGVTDLLSGLAGRLCSLAQHAGRTVSAAKRLATGHVGSAVKQVLGEGTSGAAAATTAVGLAAVVAWATDSEGFALRETEALVRSSVRPQLGAAWFSRVYWRMAGIAVLLTLPFLCAAAVQALVASDLALLVRATFGYLPLAMLGVGVAAQVTTLLLAATDDLCRFVSGAAGNAGSDFLLRAIPSIGVLSLGAHSPFLAFLVAVFTIAGAVLLWTELMLRDAAVYVIVAMLPLAFAALVWPARRVWAVRAVELLVALVLSKLAIVAVLTLGGAALESQPSVARWLAGFVLLLLGVFAPWAMVRLVPVAELASGAVGRLRGEVMSASGPGRLAHDIGEAAHNWASGTVTRMRSDAEGVDDPGRSGAEAELAGLGAGTAPTEDPPDGRADARAGSSAAEPVAAAVPAVQMAEPSRERAAAEPAESRARAPGDAASDERGPGMERIFQAPDRSWGKQPIENMRPEDRLPDGDPQTPAPAATSAPGDSGTSHDPDPASVLDVIRPAPQDPDAGRL